MTFQCRSQKLNLGLKWLSSVEDGCASQCKGPHLDYPAQSAFPKCQCHPCRAQRPGAVRLWEKCQRGLQVLTRAKEGKKKYNCKRERCMGG